MYTALNYIKYKSMYKRLQLDNTQTDHASTKDLWRHLVILIKQVSV